MNPRRGRSGWILALLVAAAAVLLRLPHLGWGLPGIEEEALPLKKAFAMGGWGGGPLQLDPQTAGWPSPSFYVHLLLHHLVYAVGRISGAFGGRADFHALQQDFTPLVLAGRALGVLAAGVIVLVAVRLGRRLAGGSWGLPAGLLAGGVLALSPLLYAESRLIAPDILLTMLAALAIARLVDIVETGRRRDYLWAAVWIGLGASAKYSPLLLVPALYAAHLLRRRREGRAAGPGLGDRRLWWAAVACIAAFAVTSPYLVLDLAVLQRDVADQFTHLGDGHLGHEACGGISFYYLRDLLAPALGWPGLLVGMAGLGWAAWRRRGAWLAGRLAARPRASARGAGRVRARFLPAVPAEPARHA